MSILCNQRTSAITNSFFASPPKRSCGHFMFFEVNNFISVSILTLLTDFVIMISL